MTESEKNVDIGNEVTIYNKNYLTRVILTINFSQILGLNEVNPPSEFQKKIMQKFPYLEIKRNQELSFNLSPISPPIKPNERIEWVFENKKRSKKVTINETSFMIEYYKYQNFNEFFEDLIFLFDIFTEIYPITLFKIRLRYINEIKEKGNYRKWEGLINDSLITIPNEFVEDSSDILNSMHTLEIGEEEYILKFNFGLHNTNYPDKITDKLFILDYECVTIDDLEKEKVYSTIKHYNQIITNWFENSIGDKLRTKMGEHYE